MPLAPLRLHGVLIDGPDDPRRSPFTTATMRERTPVQGTVAHPMRWLPACRAALSIVSSGVLVRSSRRATRTY